MAMGRLFTRLGATFATAAVLVVAPLGSIALANDPTGACCLASGSCEELQAGQCAGEGGTFIGEDTSCLMIECAAPLAAPALSIFGIVAAVGALTALGIRRLIVGRRPS
jgi:hypothetical protein